MARHDEIQRRAALVAELDTIANRDVQTAEEIDRFTAVEAEIAECDGRLARFDAVERAAVGNDGSHVSGDGTQSTYGDKNVNVNRNRTEAWEPGSGSMLDRAKAAVENVRMNDALDPDGSRDKMMRLVERNSENPIVSHWVVSTSDPAYERAFSKLLRHGPQVGLASLENDERDAMLRTQRSSLALGNTGSYLVPLTLDPSVIQTSDGTVSFWRDLATVTTIATNSWNGITSAGVTAAYESSDVVEVGDGTPTFGQKSIPVYRGDVYCEASWAVLQDAPGLTPDLTMLIMEAKKNLEDTKFTVGSGVNEPTGAITAVAAITASRVAGSSGASGSATFVVQDIYNLRAALPPRARNGQGVAWVGSDSIFMQCRQFALGSNGQNASFWATLGVDMPELLLGKPIFEASAADQTTVSGSNDDQLVIGDWRAGFRIIDRIGASISMTQAVGSSHRPVASTGFFLYFRNGSDMVDPNRARLLRL
jgi:HK97 family phage major capsid protein